MLINIYSYLVAQFSQAYVFQSRDVFDDVLQVIDVGEVPLHSFVELVYRLREFLAEDESEEVCEVA